MYPSEFFSLSHKTEKKGGKLERFLKAKKPQVEPVSHKSVGDDHGSVLTLEKPLALLLILWPANHLFILELEVLAGDSSLQLKPEIC